MAWKFFGFAFMPLSKTEFHYVITNHTLAKIVYQSADHEKKHIELITWKNAPDDFDKIVQIYLLK